MMYSKNDIVIYSSYGLCKITEISKQNFGGVSENYYTLSPVYDEKSTLFVPANNKNLVEKMKPVMSKSEIYGLIESISAEDNVWIDDENKRKEKYKEILSGGNRTEIIKMIRSVYQMKVKRQSEGKKLHVADERFFKDAERLINEEFAYVLDIERGKVVEFITEKIAPITK